MYDTVQLHSCNRTLNQIINMKPADTCFRSRSCQTGANTMCARSVVNLCGGRCLIWRGTPEGPSVQKFANLAEARESGGLEIVFNQQ